MLRGYQTEEESNPEFTQVVQEIERANAGVEQIAEMVRKNVAVVGQAVTELGIFLAAATAL